MQRMGQGLGNTVWNNRPRSCLDRSKQLKAWCPQRCKNVGKLSSATAKFIYYRLESISLFSAIQSFEGKMQPRNFLSGFLTNQDTGAGYNGPVLIPALRRQRQADLSELEASMVYIVSSRLATDTQWDPIFNKRKSRNVVLGADSLLTCEHMQGSPFARIPSSPALFACASVLCAQAHVCPGNQDQTQLASLGGKHLHLLTYLISPINLPS